MKSDILLIKTDSEGNQEWSQFFSNEGDSFDPRSVKQTIDGGYIISGVNLMKLSSQGEFEWINENPIEVDDIINTDFDVRQMNDGGYLLIGYYPNNDLENGVPFIIKVDNLGNVLSRVDADAITLSFSGLTTWAYICLGVLCTVSLGTASSRIFMRVFFALLCLNLCLSITSSSLLFE